MRIVFMNGGLGNQVFQYIFMRYIERKTGEECIIDDTVFFQYTEETLRNPVHNGYQIDRIFSLEHKRLSNVLDNDVFEELVRRSAEPLAPDMPGRGIVPVFKEMGVDLNIIQEGPFYSDAYKYSGESIKLIPPNDFHPEIVKYFGDIYYYGYWINARWFASIASVMLRELTFPAIPDEKNRNYFEEIRSAGERSVSVHIRRGDFVTTGCAESSDVFASLISKMRIKINDPYFFVFSDDIPWVKDNLNELGFKASDDIVFVEGNFRETSYIDMQLMKECRGMVFTNSSFSYLASLLNTRKDKVVCQSTTREVIFYD